MKTGLLPAPAPTVVCPILLACGQVPVLACGSLQSVTFESIPRSPTGVLTVTPDRRCSPSPRESVTVSGLKAPAWLFVLPAVKDGAKPAGPQRDVMPN